MDRAPRRLGFAAAALVLAGIALSVVGGLAAGMDLLALVLLAAVVGAGLLVLAAVTKMDRGNVDPGRCRECGGLISPHSPYCKHCGEPQRATGASGP